MQIRPHTPADFPALAALRWLLKTDDARFAAGHDKDAFVERYLAHLAESECDGRTVHWLIEDGDVIAGVMTVRIVAKEPAPDEASGCWGYLTNAYVLPAWRNRGHGTRLLEAVKTWAGVQGLELLIVWPSEASYSFYRRAGFTGRDDPLQLVLFPDEG